MDEAGVGAGAQQLDLAAGLVRQPRVVGVEQGDQVAGRLGEPARGGGGDAGVGLLDHADPARVGGGVLREQLRRAVGRAVVDDDDVEPVGGIVLAEDAVERLAQVGGVVVRADQRRDRRQGRTHRRCERDGRHDLCFGTGHAHLSGAV